jgi:serine protease Do
MDRIRTVLVAGLALGAGAGVGYGISSGDTVLSLGAQTAPVLSDEQTVIQVARQISPAVVSVGVRGGAGSGVIIRSDGVILTNAHVVANAQAVEVGLADGRTLPGRVLGRDPSVDIAVVQVQATSLPVAPIADSDMVEVGQMAIAIGNPLGLERTLTRGVISAVNRDPQGMALLGLLQTDAAINPGNSGGPLLDSQGRVIGINTAILRGATGLGFAVPINLAADVANQLLTTGVVRRPYMGINIQDLQPAVAARFQLPIQAGVIVQQVGANTPAAAAGMRPGDVITQVDGVTIERGGDFRRVLRERQPGQSVRVRIWRPAGFADLRVVLGEQRIR